MKLIIKVLIIFECLFSLDYTINTTKILKENQAFAINARNNTIDYILEIRPDGKIIKKTLAKKQKEIIQKQPNLNNKKANNEINKKQWDKKKIIYEQSVEIIDNLN